TSLSTSVLYQTVSLSATVSAIAPGAGTPTGTVTFKDGTNVLGTSSLSLIGGSMRAGINFSGTAGAHTLTPVYKGDNNDQSSTSNSVTQTVSTTPQIEGGFLAVPGTATAATIILTPTLPTGASSYSMQVAEKIGTKTTTFGTYAVQSILVYG